MPGTQRAVRLAHAGEPVCLHGAWGGGLDKRWHAGMLLRTSIPSGFSLTSTADDWVTSTSPARIM